MLQDYVAEANNAVQFLFSVEMSIVMISGAIIKFGEVGWSKSAFFA